MILLWEYYDLNIFWIFLNNNTLQFKVAKLLQNIFICFNAFIDVYIYFLCQTGKIMKRKNKTIKHMFKHTKHISEKKRTLIVCIFPAYCWSFRTNTSSLVSMLLSWFRQSNSSRVLKSLNVCFKHFGKRRLHNAYKNMKLL